MVLGRQGGYTKYPCVLCLWNSRADDQHFVRHQEWPPIQHLEPGSYNVQARSLVEPNKILLPSLHVKLRLMKNFVKAMNKDGIGFAFLLQAVIFDGPQIRELMKGLNV